MNMKGNFIQKFIGLLLISAMVCNFAVPAFAADTSVLSEQASVSSTEVQNQYEELEKYLEKIDPAYLEAYKNLTSEQKETKLRELSKAYTVGEVLSEADTAFILLNMYENAQQPQLLHAEKSKSYSVNINKFAVKGTFNGVMKQKIATGGGACSYGGTAHVNITAGSAKRVMVKIQHTAYGVLGMNGSNNLPNIGVVYDNNVSLTKESGCNSTNMDKSDQYTSILPAYTVMYASATITKTNGDEFTCESDTWTEHH